MKRTCENCLKEVTNMSGSGICQNCWDFIHKFNTNLLIDELVFRTLGKEQFKRWIKLRRGYNKGFPKNMIKRLENRAE